MGEATIFVLFALGVVVVWLYFAFASFSVRLDLYWLHARCISRQYVFVDFWALGVWDAACAVGVFAFGAVLSGDHA